MKTGFIYLLAAGCALSSCKKESQPAEENDNELITTIQLDVTKRGSGNQFTFIWEDPDGPGGDLPVSDTIRLDEQSVYDVRMSFWNKAVTPAENITSEITAESDAHRIYYDPSASTGITIDGLDNDVNGVTLGLNSVWTTTASPAGNVTIVLRHYPEGGKEPQDEVNSTKSVTDAGAIFNVAGD